MNSKINLPVSGSAVTLETLALQGQNSIHCTLASGIGARVQDLRKSLIKDCFTRIESTEHRMEYVANVHGIEFINDSRATNINATWYSLGSMAKPVIWIAGGVDMGNDFEILKMLVRSKVKAIVCLGKDCSRLYKAFADLDKPFTETPLMFEAVELALFAGEDGDVVLFSPACASFDLFMDYEERGRAFREAVKTL
jgi:UDP-N-acetylmuramoylalanine--D-glutamate ligase